MNIVIDYSGRRMVVITDPHIKINKTYDVFVQGVKKDKTTNEDGTVNSIFVKSRNLEIF
jgi:hypothetical protein